MGENIRNTYSSQSTCTKLHINSYQSRCKRQTMQKFKNSQRKEPPKANKLKPQFNSVLLYLTRMTKMEGNIKD